MMVIDPDRLVRVELMSGPQRGDVVNCEPGNLVVAEPTAANGLQNLGPWIPAGTALALCFWSPAVGVYAGLMFVGSGAVMLCLSIFGINGNPARGEGGLDNYFSFALPKFRRLNFTFQAGLAGASSGRCLSGARCSGSQPVWRVSCSAPQGCGARTIGLQTYVRSMKCRQARPYALLENLHTLSHVSGLTRS